MRDVATAASVSPSAAGAALRGEGRLHDETRARILAVAEELGYRRNALARSLRRSSNGVAATVLYNMPDSESSRRPTSFWEEALFGYVQELARASIGNVFVPADQAETLLPELPADVVVILNLPGGEHGPVIQVPGGPPIVRAVFASGPDAQGRSTTSGEAAAFIIWNYDAALDVVFSHLLDGGARAPGLLLPPRPLAPTALIREAHNEWCRRRGVPVLRSDSTDIATGTRELLDLGCDSFLVHGDHGAGDVDLVLDTILAAGRSVPQDVRLVSISDGSRELHMEPSITCLTYDGMNSGVQIARMVIDGLATGRFRDVLVDWGLRVAESTTV